MGLAYNGLLEDISVVTYRPNGRARYRLMDHQASCRIVIDSSLITRFDYTPFGERVSSSAHSRKGFNERDLDEESQLQNHGVRNYDPSLGRFLQADPLWSSNTSVTPYDYSYSNPLTVSDPDGKQARELIWIVGNLQKLQQYTQFLLTPLPKDAFWARYLEDATSTAQSYSDRANFSGILYQRFDGIEYEWAKTADGGTLDAVRHVYWSAMLARDLGYEMALGITDLNESIGDNSDMDRHNNGVGIRIGCGNPDADNSTLLGLSIKALGRGELKGVIVVPPRDPEVPSSDTRPGRLDSNGGLGAY